MIAEQDIAVDAPVEEDRHVERCGCLTCQSRRWLHHTPPNDGPCPVCGGVDDPYGGLVVLKITTYGGRVSGTAEPDRNYDVICSNADFQRALSLIPSQHLRPVAKAWMETPDPEVPIPRPKGYSGPLTREEAVQGLLNTDSNSIHRMLDQCAMEMGNVLGERNSGLPCRPHRETDEERALRIEAERAYALEKSPTPTHRRYPLSAEQMVRKMALQQKRRKRVSRP